MAVHLRVIENTTAPVRKRRSSSEARGDLSLRLIRAFSSISDEGERLKIVEMAEEAADPIWDY